MTRPIEADRGGRGADLGGSETPRREADEADEVPNSVRSARGRGGCDGGRIHRGIRRSQSSDTDVDNESLLASFAELQSPRSTRSTPRSARSSRRSPTRRARGFGDSHEEATDGDADDAGGRTRGRARARGRERERRRDSRPSSMARACSERVRGRHSDTDRDRCCGRDPRRRRGRGTDATRRGGSRGAGGGRGRRPTTIAPWRRRPTREPLEAATPGRPNRRPSTTPRRTPAVRGCSRSSRPRAANASRRSTGA